jgi:hypothetical protein
MDTLIPQNAALAPEHYDQAVERLGRVGGFAPGSYISHCVACDRQFLGDKRAINCLPCAVAALVARTDPPKPAPSAEGVERAARIIHFVHGDDLTVEAALHRDNDAHWQHWRDQEPQGSEAAFRAAAAILALPAQSVSQTDTLSDPVAWRRMHTSSPAEWVFTTTKAQADAWAGIGEQFHAEPLYAAPPSPGRQSSIHQPSYDAGYTQGAFDQAQFEPSPGPETGVEISEEMVGRAARELARVAERKAMPSGRSAMVFANHSEWRAQLDSRVNSSWREHVASARACLTAALQPQTSSKGE